MKTNIVAEQRKDLIFQLLVYANSFLLESEYHVPKSSTEFKGGHRIWSKDQVRRATIESFKKWYGHINAALDGIEETGRFELTTIPEIGFFSPLTVDDGSDSIDMVFKITKCNAAVYLFSSDPPIGWYFDSGEHAKNSYANDSLTIKHPIFPRE